MIEDIKLQIKKSFNKASNTYDTYALLQQKICIRSIDLLQQYSDNSDIIIDMACGTGISTAGLRRAFSGSKIYALDFAENLLQIARCKFLDSAIEFILADYDDKIFSESYADIIYCNMGLQWALNLTHNLKLFHYYLKTCGIFCFTLPLQGTLSELNSAYRNKLYKRQEVEFLLKKHGFEILVVQEQDYQYQFKNQLSALQSIKRIGANCLTATDNNQVKPLFYSKHKISEIFVDANEHSLSYHVGIFIVRKEEIC